MGLTEFFFSFLDGIPLIRALVRKIVERRLEIEIENGSYRVQWVHRGRYPPHFKAVFNLTLVNHHSANKERVRNCRVALKEWRFIFWRKTLAVSDFILTPEGVGINNVLLEARGEPYNSDVEVYGEIPFFSPLPKMYELVLELDMIGEKRRIRRLLRRYNFLWRDYESITE